MEIQTDVPSLVRDPHSRALSPRREALEEFRRAKKKEELVFDLENRVESIEMKLDKLLELLGANK